MLVLLGLEVDQSNGGPRMRVKMGLLLFTNLYKILLKYFDVVAHIFA